MKISVFGEQHKILLVFTVKTANFFILDEVVKNGLCCQNCLFYLRKRSRCKVYFIVFLYYISHVCQIMQRQKGSAGCV